MHEEPPAGSGPKLRRGRLWWLLAAAAAPWITTAVIVLGERLA